MSNRNERMIEKALTLSTAHITLETRDWLNNEGKEHLQIYPKASYGWFIYVGDFPEKDIEAIPKQIQFLAGYAAGKECCWLQLDRDADEYEDIPSYEW